MDNNRSDAGKIFVSYSRTDGLIVHKIVDILRESGFDLWIDSTAIQPGQDWQKRIFEGLEESQILLLFVSPDSMKSEFVRNEWEAFYTRQKSILPVMLRDAPEVPQQLSRIAYIDFRKGITDDDIEKLIASLDRLLSLEMIPPASSAGFDQPPPTPPTGSGVGIPPETPEPIPQKGQESAGAYDVEALALSDKPTDKDLLGFEIYAEALANFILHPNTDKPLTIAVDAAWGMGKSSLMMMIRKQIIQQIQQRLKEDQRIRWRDRRLEFVVDLRDRAAAIRAGISNALRKSILRRFFPERNVPKNPPVPTVWFNAWKYDQEEALWAALALETMNQVTEQYGFWRRLNFKRRLSGFDLRRLFFDLLASASYLVLVTILGIVVLVALSLFPGNALPQDALDVFPAFAAGGLIALYRLGNGLIEGSKTLFNLKVEKYVREEPDYKERIGFLGEFEKDFKRLVKVITDSGKHPLIIFIDDLDRCAVPRAAEVVEAINLFLNADSCVFIIGMDIRTVAASIEVHYEKLKAQLNPNSIPLALGRQFLEKIIQINFPIPRPDSAAMKRFIAANLRKKVEQRAASEETREQIEQGKVQAREKQRDLGEITSFDKINVLSEEVGSLSFSSTNIRDQVQQQIRQEAILENFDNLAEVESVINEMTRYLGNNPRRVKRFMNVFRLQAFIAIKRGKLTDRRQLESLGAWLAIAFRWPEFVECMIHNPSFDNNLYHTHENQATIEALRKNDPKNPQILILEEEIKNYADEPNIQKFIGEKDLIKLLPETTSFSDDELNTILLPTMQIVASMPMFEAA